MIQQELRNGNLINVFEACEEKAMMDQFDYEIVGATEEQFNAWLWKEEWFDAETQALAAAYDQKLDEYWEAQLKADPTMFQINGYLPYQEPKKRRRSRYKKYKLTMDDINKIIKATKEHYGITDKK